MEMTLFGKSMKTGGGIKFEERRVKVCLRRGGVEGKSIGKAYLNFAEFVGAEGKGGVEREVELSNGSRVGLRVENELLFSGKDKKGKGVGRNGVDVEGGDGGDGGGGNDDMYSEIGDDDGGDDESRFGGDESEVDNSEFADLVDTKIETQDEKGFSSVVVPESPRRQSKGRFSSFRRKKNSSEEEKDDASAEMKSQDDAQENGKTDGPSSFRKKLLSASGSKRLLGRSSSRKVDDSNVGRSKGKKIEKLEARVNALEEENRALKKTAHKYKQQTTKLKAELDDTTRRSENESRNAVTDEEVCRLRETVEMQRSLIAELQRQKEDLVCKLEAGPASKIINLRSRSESSSLGSLKGLSLQEENACLREKVGELEILLERDPEFSAVVNELKVVKMNLALATMEKEQAVLAAKVAEKINAESLASPVTPKKVELEPTATELTS